MTKAKISVQYFCRHSIKKLCSAEMSVVDHHVPQPSPVMRSTSHQTSFVMPSLVPTESAIDKDQHNFVHLKLIDHINGCGALCEPPLPLNSHSG